MLRVRVRVRVKIRVRFRFRVKIRVKIRVRVRVRHHKMFCMLRVRVKIRVRFRIRVRIPICTKYRKLKISKHYFCLRKAFFIFTFRGLCFPTKWCTLCSWTQRSHAKVIWGHNFLKLFFSLQIINFKLRITYPKFDLIGCIIKAIRQFLTDRLHVKYRKMLFSKAHNS